MLCQDEARNVSQIFHNGFPQPCLKLQYPPIKEDWIRKFDMAKLENLIRRHYLDPAKGICNFVIPRQPVPKCPTDIRVMWNCTKNEVNNIIVVISFSLPTKSTLFQKVINGVHMEDFDIGEKFHNYLLWFFERAFHCGVISLGIFKTMKETESHMRWT